MWDAWMELGYWEMRREEYQGGGERDGHGFYKLVCQSCLPDSTNKIADPSSPNDYPYRAPMHDPTSPDISLLSSFESRCTRSLLCTIRNAMPLAIQNNWGIFPSTLVFAQPYHVHPQRSSSSLSLPFFSTAYIKLFPRLVFLGIMSARFHHFQTP